MKGVEKLLAGPSSDTNDPRARVVVEPQAAWIRHIDG